MDDKTFHVEKKINTLFYHVSVLSVLQQGALMGSALPFWTCCLSRHHSCGLQGTDQALLVVGLFALLTSHVQMLIFLDSRRSPSCWFFLLSLFCFGIAILCAFILIYWLASPCRFWTSHFALFIFLAFCKLVLLVVLFNPALLPGISVILCQSRDHFCYNELFLYSDPLLVCIF